MSKPVLRYFDFAASRGEEVRLALVMAGVAFDDDRMSRDDFARVKPELPFGSLPVLEVPGRGTFAQTNAMLRLIGRLHNLHPEDPWDAARHDAVLEACEDLRQRISATTRLSDAAEKSAARQALAKTIIPHWAKGIEALIGAGPYVGGAEPAVADIKIFMMAKALNSGSFDDIPTTVLAPYLRIAAVAKGVETNPAVRAWYAPKAG
ncbi:MAG: glutathione S-transferase family protein [Albidovulum sp.]